MASPIPILKTSQLSKRFGGLTAVDNVDFEVAPGSITSLIGPNGAGKTTFFNLVVGVYQPTAGQVEFAGQRVGAPELFNTPEKMARRGLCRTFQNIRLFSQLSALENVMLGVPRHNPWWQELLTDARSLKVAKEKAIEMLDFVGLRSRAKEQSTSLAYGHQRLLEIARALASQPRLLLLDEPAAGMNPQETLELTQLIRAIRDRGISILLIEHDVRLVMEISDEVYVFDHGQKIACGDPTTVANSPQVIEAYLGTSLETQG